MQITQEQINELKQSGYTDQDIREAWNELQQEQQQSPLQQSFQQTQQMVDARSSASNSMFSAKVNENLIQWQLELDSILERVEHMLRGDRIKFKDGQMIWIPPVSDNEKRLNDYGVGEIMRILSMYLNRNTILSNYDEDTINWKVLDFGKEITDLFFMKYEEMGLNTLEKRKLYPMIVREIVDVVHSSYLRALHGGERLSLREARQVSQQEQIMPGININTGQPMRPKGILNPMRYLGGKYK